MTRPPRCNLTISARIACSKKDTMSFVYTTTLCLMDFPKHRNAGISRHLGISTHSALCGLSSSTAQRAATWGHSIAAQHTAHGTHYAHIRPIHLTKTSSRSHAWTTWHRASKYTAARAPKERTIDGCTIDKQRTSEPWTSWTSKTVEVGLASVSPTHLDVAYWALSKWPKASGASAHGFGGAQCPNKLRTK